MVADEMCESGVAELMCVKRGEVGFHVPVELLYVERDTKNSRLRRCKTMQGVAKCSEWCTMFIEVSQVFPNNF